MKNGDREVLARIDERMKSLREITDSIRRMVTKLTDNQRNFLEKEEFEKFKNDQRKQTGIYFAIVTVILLGLSVFLSN